VRRIVTIVAVLSAGMLFPAAAFAQSATTGTANPVAVTSATLNAIVNPGGETLYPGTDGGCYFEYGTTDSYGSKVECSSLPSGSSNQSVNASLSGLTAGQTYDYQIVLVTEADPVLGPLGLDETTTDGGNQTFTAGTGTPTVADPTSSDVGSSAATVSTDVNPQGVAIASCNVYYGPAVSPPATLRFSGSAACSGTPSTTDPGSYAVSAVASGLSSFTSYQYIVQLTYCAVAGGCSSASQDTTVDSAVEGFKTLSVGTAVTGPAVAITADSATLTATVSNPQGVTIVGCEFIYGPAGSAATIPCAESVSSSAFSDAETVTANIAGLTPSTTYPYVVVLETANGDAVGSTASFETDAYPSAVTDAPASVTYESATLKGTVDPEGTVVNSCQFNLTPKGGNSSQIACSPGATSISGTSPISVTASESGLLADTTYSYTVELDTALGDFVGPTVTFTTPVLPAPTATTGTASATGSTTAKLNATVNAHGQAVIACEFEFGIGPFSGSNYGLDVACSPSPGSGQTAVSVNLKGLAPNTTYYYRVLFKTVVGYIVGATKSFHTPAPGSNPEPIARFTRTVISTSKHTAQFYWTHSGGSPNYIACSLARIKNGKVQSHTFRRCSTGKRYTGLADGTWIFYLRMSNNAGQSQASAKFKI
jgi:hypothetical protein